MSSSEEEQVPNNLSQEQLRDLARAGAAVRVEELQRELQSLIAAFPELRSTGQVRRRPGRPAKVVSNEGTPQAERAVRRRKRRLSAAARREISERMRKYWAERRKSRGKA